MVKKLAHFRDYEINIRSFHPEKDFGWSGLLFEGDNRQFSLQRSGGSMVTSRIWHRFKLSLKSGNFFDDKTVSDPSKAPWDDENRVYNGILAPKGRLTVKRKILPHNVHLYKIEGKYGGVNHAMPGSPELQKTLGFSYVPTLNVKYKIIIEIDRANHHIDIVTYITGDAFPNCEAFIVGPNNQPISLGVHVRKGVAPLSLSLNADYPMIASAIRIPIDSNGNFKETVADELSRQANKQPKLSYQKITDWNYRFISTPANSGRCMLLEKASLTGCFNGVLE